MPLSGRFSTYSAVRIRPATSLPFSSSDAALLFDLLSKLYEKASVAITINLSLREWVGVFGDAKMTTAMLDRLTRHCHIAETSDDSFRFKPVPSPRKTEGKKARNLTSA